MSQRDRDCYKMPVAPVRGDKPPASSTSFPPLRLATGAGGGEGSSPFRRASPPPLTGSSSPGRLGGPPSQPPALPANQRPKIDPAVRARVNGAAREFAPTPDFQRLVRRSMREVQANIQRFRNYNLGSKTYDDDGRTEDGENDTPPPPPPPRGTKREHSSSVSSTGGGGGKRASTNALHEATMAASLYHPAVGPSAVVARSSAGSGFNSFGGKKNGSSSPFGSTGSAAMSMSEDDELGDMEMIDLTRKD